MLRIPVPKASSCVIETRYVPGVHFNSGFYFFIGIYKTYEYSAPQTSHGLLDTSRRGARRAAASVWVTKGMPPLTR